MTMKHDSYSHLIHRRQIENLSKLLGEVITGIVYDDDDTGAGRLYGLRLTGGTIAWILCDPEGNGPGHLELESTEGRISK